jgi:hypothetical protein
MQAVHALGIQHGWEIYTNDGEHLGTAKSVTDTYVVVEKGRIFKQDLYIPLSAFMEADETEHRATLSVTSDQIDGMGWDQPVGTGDDSAAAAGSGANNLPPVTDSSARPRPQLAPEPGQAAIDDPEAAQPGTNLEPRGIDAP